MKILFAALFCILSLNSFVFAEEILIIVNNNGPLVNISDEDIKKVYKGEKRFEAGVKIIPVELDSVKEQFLSSFIGTTSKDYRVHWTKKVFQDGIQPPATMPSIDDVMELVKMENGAIGYVGRKGFKDESNIKIIKTIK